MADGRLVMNPAEARAKASEMKNIANELETLLNNVSRKFLDLKLQFLGYVHNDISIPRAVKQQKPFVLLYPDCTASKNLSDIAKKIMKEPVNNTKDSGIKGFFNKFFAGNNEI